MQDFQIHWGARYMIQKGCLQGRNNEQSGKIMTILRRDTLLPQGSFIMKTKSEETFETSPHF